MEGEDKHKDKTWSMKKYRNGMKLYESTRLVEERSILSKILNRYIQINLPFLIKDSIIGIILVFVLL